VIRLSSVRYRYPGSASPWVLNSIDLSIGEGDYLLLCGRSGSGKSTLGALLNGLIPHFFEGTLEGRVWINGQDTRGLTVADLLSTVGMVFQNAEAQLFNSTVENEIAFGLESLGLDPREIERRIQETARDLTLEHLLGRSPMTLSGGEKRLVAIASVLCLNPPVLVLDEPLAHLDWEGARKIREVLNLLHQRGKTLVVIEQRLTPVLDDANRCVVMGGGKILFDGGPQGARDSLEKQQLIPHYPPMSTPSRGPDRTILQARDLCRWMEKEPVLQDVRLEIKEGEILAMVGKNGAGKTTLIRHLNGLLRPHGGVVEYRGRDIRGMAPPEMAARVGISFQNANDQFFKSRVKDELMAGLPSPGPEDHRWVEELISLFDLDDLLHLSPYRLSEGQKKRVAIASVLIMRPRVLILDEPTVGQDGRFLETVARILVSLREKGITMVVVTHDLEFARATAHRLVLVEGGKIGGMAVPGTGEEETLLARTGFIGPEGFGAVGGGA